MSRYESFRRSGFQKANMKRVCLPHQFARLVYVFLKYMLYYIKCNRIHVGSYMLLICLKLNYFYI